MGEAKRRGTEEERKAKAISEGRVKRCKPSKRQVEREVMGGLLGLFDLSTFVMPYYINRRQLNLEAERINPLKEPAVQIADVGVSRKP